MGKHRSQPSPSRTTPIQDFLTSQNTYVVIVLKIAYHPNYHHPIPKNHRFPMAKYSQLPELLKREHAFTEEYFFEAQMVEDDIILTTHDADYLERLHKGTISRKEEREIGFTYSPELITREITILGGTIQCAEYALENGVAMNIAGGTHHAFTNRGEGFCILNDQAVATNYLLGEGKAKKVLIIDLDVHQGNGTAEIFRNNPNVFTFSMHGEHNYPFRKEKSDLDIPLPNGANDSYFLNTLKNVLPRIISTFKPDFLFYQSGVDILATDKLGKLGMTLNGCFRRDEFVLGLAHRLEIPIVACMGGGYSPNLEDILEAHANTYRIAKAFWG